MSRSAARRPALAPIAPRFCDEEQRGRRPHRNGMARPHQTDKTIRAFAESGGADLAASEQVEAELEVEAGPPSGPSSRPEARLVAAPGGIAGF